MFGQALRRPEHAEGLERVQRQIASMEDLVKRFPLINPKASLQPVCMPSIELGRLIVQGLPTMTLPLPRRTTACRRS